MKKVAIVGRGTAGALGALHLNRYLDKNEFEIEWMFDNSIPTQSVGEGSTILLPNALYETSGLTHSSLYGKLGGTIKTGIKKTGWGGDTDFHHDFYGGGVGYHFQASMLHQYSFDYLKDKISITDTHVGNIDNVDADFVFDCSGRPKEYNNDFTMSDMVVNTARVWQCPWDKPRFSKTLTLARPYGWVFGIPLSDRLSIGYIYNKDYASLDMIEDDIKEVFEEYNIEPGEDGNYIEFDSYYRKENFDGRVGHSGNSSFFLEPLEATSTSTMDLCNRQMLETIHGYIGPDMLNNAYREFIQKTEHMIMVNYLGGSKWNTDFWKYAVDKAERSIYRAIKGPLGFDSIFKSGIEMVEKNTHICNTEEYGSWAANSFALHFKKLGIMGKLRELAK